MSDESIPPRLTREKIEILFCDLADRLMQENKVVDVAVYGGSALVLQFDFRKDTHDLDITAGDDAYALKTMSMDVGLQHNLEPGWFSDGVEIFKSDKEALRFYKAYPSNEHQSLRIFTASPEYLLAMKILSMREPWNAPDMLDVQNLVKVMGIKTPEAAMEVVQRFYPGKTIPRKNQLFLQDIFDEMATPQMLNRQPMMLESISSAAA